ncbi:MAG: arylesterase, partial [Methyloprofundus sp.]|nr:arylesterase [Methyloprofundus sp.]
MKEVFLLAFILLISACDNKPKPVFNKLSDEAVILAFGDSLTYGTGASKGASYPVVLSALSARQVINAGIPGEVSRNGLARLPALLDKHQPELLVLIHGGNDMLRKIPEQQISDNIKQMISEAKQRNIKVVMLGVPKFNLFLLSSAQIYQKIAEENKIPIDLESLPHILSDNALKSDTIHPNDQGYRL